MSVAEMALHAKSDGLHDQDGLQVPFHAEGVEGVGVGDEGLRHGPRPVVVEGRENAVTTVQRGGGDDDDNDDDMRMNI